MTPHRRPPPAAPPRASISQRSATRPVRFADLHALYRPEVLALAAAYLRAFGAGETATADTLLSSCEPAELVAGLTVLGCILADDLGDRARTGTTVILESTWRRCAAYHRDAVGLP